MLMNLMRDPDVLPLLLISNPNPFNNLDSSSKVKSFGCLMNRSISLSFVPIAIMFMQM
jgi:hypothetical protein